MPDAVTYRVQTYYKRPRGEPGITQLSSVRISASLVLEWVLADLIEANEDAVDITHSDDGATAVITIRWGELPESIRNPLITPARRR